MIINIGSSIATSAAISSAHTTIQATHTAIYQKSRKNQNQSNDDGQIESVTLLPEERKESIIIYIPLIIGFSTLLIMLASLLWIAFGVLTREDIHSGRVNPAAVERARLRDVAAMPPDPIFLYSQKVSTKILYVGSHKHVRVRVRNQATGGVDSVYLCKKYCGLDLGEPAPGSIVNVTWHSYRGPDGVFQRVDEAEILRMF